MIDSKGTILSFGSGSPLTIISITVIDDVARVDLTDMSGTENCDLKLPVGHACSSFIAVAPRSPRAVAVNLI